MGNLDDIRQAMANMKVISFDYTNARGLSGPRTVEPHLIGKTKAKKTMLSAYQIGGTTHDANHPWKQYDLQKIYNLVVLDQTFNPPREGYNKNDSRYSPILARV